MLSEVPSPLDNNNNNLFLAYLAGKEMSTDFHKDLVVLVWSLVPRYDDLSTRQVLQLVYLKIKKKKRLQRSSCGFEFHLQPKLQNTVTEYQIMSD